MSNESLYGEQLIRLDLDGARPEVLKRIPLKSGVADGSVDEATLQELLFDYPECLPIPVIDPAYADAVPICRELRVPAGSIDALFVNHPGRLTLCEFKLWRNPQARREVIGQILDYAKDLAGLRYEDLQRQVSLALGRQGGNALFDLVRERHPNVVEAEFVDNVTRHLRRGEFLLLVVGDGIREGVEKIVDFVQRHSGLHFNLALVEAALYRDTADRLIVQPRVLARTEIVRRFVVDGSVEVQAGAPDGDGEQEPLSDQEEENLRFWTAVLRGYSFSDGDVEAPAPSKWSNIAVKVGGSGFGGFALSFCGYVYRARGSVMGCYLTCRRDQPREVRIFEEIVASLEDVRREIRASGVDRDGTREELELWYGANQRPRLGFKRTWDLSFLAGSEESEAYRVAVDWMRDRLNRLVSGLHPRLQEMLADD